MRCLIAMLGCVLLSSAAAADDRDEIKQQMQELANAIAPGDAAVWDKYLDPDLIFAEEDDSFKGKAAAVKEILPLPGGMSGTISVELLSYHEDGDVAIALFRQHEAERYFGQTLHANYLTNTTWKKRAGGWRMLAAQVVAERTDPPSIHVPEAQLVQYAGAYKLKNSDAAIVLSVAHGTLNATRNGHQATVWKAEACDVFFIEGEPRIRRIFERDGAGRIIGFVERREMWDVDWVKVR